MPEPLPPLRIGVMGLGFGLKYMRGLLIASVGQPAIRVMAVCDRDARRLAEGQKTFGCKGYDCVDALLQDQSVQAVALFTGPAGRATLIQKLIRAGKHVMTTKPFELDPAAAAAALDEAVRLNKVVQLNSPAATLPADIRQMLRWQQEHHLGRAVSANWQTWVGYRERADGSWYDDPARCPAAPVFRLGIYAINELLYFLKDPTQVQVMTSRVLTGRPTPDQANLTIRFRDGALANVSASFCTATPIPYPDRLVLNFERGSIFKNTSPTSSRESIELQLLAADEEGKPLTARADNFDTTECGGHSSYHWDVFIRAVRGEQVQNKTPDSHIVDGVRIIAAMSRSEQTGMPATV